MTDSTENKNTPPVAEAQQDVAQVTEAKAKAAATASDELSEDDLKAVSGGRYRGNLHNFARPGYRK
jgi:hypothetical protein